jgi:hypothetical protein
MFGVEGPIADPIFYKEACIPQVTIPLSDNILTSLNMEAEEIAVSMRKEFALKSFHEGKITLAQGAAFCDMNIYDFISTKSQRRGPGIKKGNAAVRRSLVGLTLAHQPCRGTAERVRV